MKPYPTDHWRALKPGYFELKGEPFNIHVLPLGLLPIPSGRLIVKDANGFGLGPQRALPVIPGSYEMTATCIEQGDVSMLAYLSITFADQETSSWKPLTPVHVREPEEEVAERLRGGFINRSAYGLMVDEELLKKGLPMDDDHCYSMLCYWQNRVDDTKSPWEGGRYHLRPNEDELEPVVIFKTRMMAGLTHIYGELDDMGMLLRCHVDLGTMERLYQKAEQS